MVDGYTNEQLFELTNIDPWFLAQFRELHNTEEFMKTKKLGEFTTEELIQIKKRGFSDPQIATATGNFSFSTCSKLGMGGGKVNKGGLLNALPLISASDEFRNKLGL